MPLYENACMNEDCPGGLKPFEWYASTSSKPNPECVECGRQTVRLISTFAVVWSSPLSKYGSKDPRVQQRNGDSHTVWRINSSKSGKPERVVIDSIQKQREFCKEEGLRLPSDTGANAEISSDGKKLSTSGMRGQWV